MREVGLPRSDEPPARPPTTLSSPGRLPPTGTPFGRSGGGPFQCLALGEEPPRSPWPVKRDFRARTGRDPVLVAHAGGRVNLIGEHTDYHEGFVFPAALDLRTLAAGAPRDDGVVRIWSDNLDAEYSYALSGLRPGCVSGHARYLLGPFWVVREALGTAPGADVVVRGDVPLGGGLSSSASLEVALVALAAALAGHDMAPMDIAVLARRCENHFCGVPCGAMDQVASACGVEGHALLLDCRTLRGDAVPFPRDWAVVVADSGVRHVVAGPEYRRRQEECEAGLRVARAAFPEVRAARDLTLAHLDDLRSRIPEVSYRRLRHVVTENQRTLWAREALLFADGPALGALLAASHESLARDYEVSCPELDFLVELASGLPGLVGARLTGAGFGGNTVNVVLRDRAAAFRDSLAAAVLSRTGRRIATHLVAPSGGVRVERA